MTKYRTTMFLSIWNYKPLCHCLGFREQSKRSKGYYSKVEKHWYGAS